VVKVNYRVARPGIKVPAHFFRVVQHAAEPGVAAFLSQYLWRLGRQHHVYGLAPDVEGVRDASDERVSDDAPVSAVDGDGSSDGVPEPLHCPDDFWVDPDLVATGALELVEAEVCGDGDSVVTP